MPLTDIVVKSAKPKEKPYKLSDAESLYLFVSATGKYWPRHQHLKFITLNLQNRTLHNVRTKRYLVCFNTLSVISTLGPI